MQMKIRETPIPMISLVKCRITTYVVLLNYAFLKVYMINICSKLNFVHISAFSFINWFMCALISPSSVSITTYSCEIVYEF